MDTCILRIREFDEEEGTLNFFLETVAVATNIIVINLLNHEIKCD